MSAPAAPRLTLTFDNGPTPGVTEKVLDVLEDRGLDATFFLIGEKLATPQGRELAERTRSAGHRLGNHTMTHGEPLGTLADPAREVAEIAEAQDVLGALSEPEKLYRPTGHGSMGPHLLSRAAMDHLVGGGYTMVLWSLFVRDSKMPEGWVERALDRLDERDWHALVVHDLPTGAMDDLARFLDCAAERGVQFTQEFPPDCLPVRRGVPAEGAERLYVTPKSGPQSGPPTGEQHGGL